MKKFSLLSECAKCNFGPQHNASLGHFARTEYLLLSVNDEHKFNHPVMRRVCPRCGYVWFELPLDHEYVN